MDHNMIETMPLPFSMGGNLGPCTTALFDQSLSLFQICERLCCFLHDGRSALSLMKMAPPWGRPQFSCRRGDGPSEECGSAVSVSGLGDIVSGQPGLLVHRRCLWVSLVDEGQRLDGGAAPGSVSPSEMLGESQAGPWPELAPVRIANAKFQTAYTHEAIYDKLIGWSLMKLCGQSAHGPQYD